MCSEYGKYVLDFLDSYFIHRGRSSYVLFSVALFFFFWGGDCSDRLESHTLSMHGHLPLANQPSHFFISSAVALLYRLLSFRSKAVGDPCACGIRGTW